MQPARWFTAGIVAVQTTSDIPRTDSVKLAGKAKVEAEAKVKVKAKRKVKEDGKGKEKGKWWCNYKSTSICQERPNSP